MSSQRRSSRLQGAGPEHVAAEDPEKTLRRASRGGQQLQTGQQPAAGTAMSRLRPTSAPLQQSAKGQQAGKQPLEAFVCALDTYFGPHSDEDMVQAAHSVADIWSEMDSQARAAAAAVLGPLLEREQQLAERAAAKAALRQERRDKFAEKGPRLTRKRAAEGPQEPTGSSGPWDAAGANNGSNQSSGRTRSNRPFRAVNSATPPPGATPPSPLLNNQQDKGSKPVSPAPAELDGTASTPQVVPDSSGSGSTVNGGDSSRLTPGVESAGVGVKHHHQQQAQQAQGTRSASRRKQQWRPCHAALQ